MRYLYAAGWFRCIPNVCWRNSREQRKKKEKTLYKFTSCKQRWNFQCKWILRSRYFFVRRGGVEFHSWKMDIFFFFHSTEAVNKSFHSWYCYGVSFDIERGAQFIARSHWLQVHWLCSVSHKNMEQFMEGCKRTFVFTLCIRFNLHSAENEWMNVECNSKIKEKKIIQLHGCSSFISIQNLDHVSFAHLSCRWWSTKYEVYEYVSFRNKCFLQRWIISLVRIEGAILTLDSQK